MITRSRLFLLAVVLCASNQAHAAFGSLWAFGDSLTDSGNAFFATGGQTAAMPYVEIFSRRPYVSSAPFPTFSNGPVWVEYLANSLALPLLPSFHPSGLGTNFAVGGALTGNLAAIGLAPVLGVDPVSVTQQAAFAASLALPADGLYVLNGGGNDIRAVLEYVGAGGALANALAAMDEAVDNLVGSIAALADAGATLFAVSNLPDVGHSPAVVAAGGSSSTLASLLVINFNSRLADGLADLRLAKPAVDIIELDTFTLFNAIRANPGDFGLSNLTSPCALENAGSGCATPDDYLFWDGLHPTTAAQLISAQAAYAAVVPVPAALCLFASAALAGFGVRRRKAALA